MIATLGPASLSPAILKRLVAAGVDLFRVNLSHGDRESHHKAISAAASTGIGVMIDLPGPKIRILDATTSFPVTLPAGDTVFLATDREALPGKRPGLLLPKGLDLSRAAVGSLVLVDDGNVELLVRCNTNGVLEAESLADAVIKDRKGVAFVDEVADFPPLVDDDKLALDELRDAPFACVAASFVRSAACVIELRDYLNRLEKKAQIIAKIESPSGVKNVEEILSHADGIMVARGDLGVCTPLAALPLLQKHLVALAVYHRKKVVVATQMLESMTWNRRPTRAEVTDVANAVLDGADAVMLSAETAVGKFPVETVEVMADIIANAERAIRTGLRRVF
ncbi:MAG: pyruvate kinase [Deltaproteobacteria bacterium]|nr:pyruvate kinase [Deltaproteobacteria bacterium]